MSNAVREDCLHVVEKQVTPGPQGIQDSFRNFYQDGRPQWASLHALQGDDGYKFQTITSPTTWY